MDGKGLKGDLLGADDLEWFEGHDVIAKHGRVFAKLLSERVKALISSENAVVIGTVPNREQLSLALATSLSMPHALIPIEPIVAPGQPGRVIGAVSGFDDHSAYEKEVICREKISDEVVQRQLQSAKSRSVSRAAQLTTGSCFPLTQLRGEQAILVDGVVAWSSKLEVAARVLAICNPSRMVLVTACLCRSIADSAELCFDKAISLVEFDGLVELSNYFQSLREIGETQLLAELTKAPPLTGFHPQK